MTWWYQVRKTGTKKMHKSKIAEKFGEHLGKYRPMAVARSLAEQESAPGAPSEIFRERRYQKALTRRVGRAKTAAKHKESGVRPGMGCEPPPPRTHTHTPPHTHGHSNA
eukprot:1490761-Rhodomonas_salina.1